LKEKIWQKRRSPKKDMIGLRGILILVMFVNIKEAHPREEQRNNLFLISVILRELNMKCVWLVQERGVTVAVCDDEATANKVIKHYPKRELQKRKESILADVIGNIFYYYS
jgi:hypothetical protein